MGEGGPIFRPWRQTPGLVGWRQVPVPGMSLTASCSRLRSQRPAGEASQPLFREVQLEPALPRWAGAAGGRHLLPESRADPPCLPSGGGRPSHEEPVSEQTSQLP